MRKRSSRNPATPQPEDATSECVRLVPLTSPQTLALAGVTTDRSGGAVVLQIVRVGMAVHMPHEGQTFYSMLPDAAQDLCRMLDHAAAELEGENSQPDPSDT